MATPEKNPRFWDSPLGQKLHDSLKSTSLKTRPFFRIPLMQKHPRFSTFRFRKKIYVFREDEKGSNHD